jgi:hypothetical protein
MTTAEIPIQARCLWCVKRIGRARYRVGTRWLTMPDNFDSLVRDITDGICGDCLEMELRKVPALNINQGAFA